MRLIFSISIAMLALSLTACGPIYKTVYDFKPPKSTIARMCINQCMQNKTSCEQICALKSQACQFQAKQNAMNEYQIYKLERERDHKSVDKTVYSFDDSWGCNQNCGCEGNFRACYTTCGGQVTPRQVCTAFCDKA